MPVCAKEPQVLKATERVRAQRVVLRGGAEGTEGDGIFDREVVTSEARRVRAQQVVLRGGAEGTEGDGALKDKMRTRPKSRPHRPSPASHMSPD